MQFEGELEARRPGPTLGRDRQVTGPDVRVLHLALGTPSEDSHIAPWDSHEPSLASHPLQAVKKENQQVDVYWTKLRRTRIIIDD